MKRLLATLFVLFSLCAGFAQAQSLSASPSSLYAGQSTTATWSGIATPTSTDWIALYVVGAPDNAFISWQYTNGAASGSAPVSFAANLASGNYELRLFANNVYTLLATSNTITVTAQPPATFSVSPTSVQAGSSVTATWGSIFAPTSTDWIALYAVGAPDNAYISWQYTNGAASGSAPFLMPPSLATGNYELRLFANNVYTLLGTSSAISVTALPPVTLSATPSSVAPGGQVTATWANIYGPTAYDWIGLYTPGGADNAFIAWQYTNGAASGSAPFPIAANVAPGTYQLRLFTNGGYVRIATSANFSVSTAKLSFIHVDHLNTPRAVYDDQQQLRWRWDQVEPFGGTVPDENPASLGAFELPLRFPGQYADKETNVHYNYYRSYDPAIGGYKESDPVGLRSGLNTYAYGSGSPLASIDPEGLGEGPAFDSSLNMNTAYLKYNNCYTYALNRGGGKEGSYFSGGSGRDPGSYSGKPFSKVDCGDIRAAARRDGAIDPQNGIGKGCEGNCPDGYYKIRLLIQLPRLFDRGDYHFQRQDAGGSWSEKRSTGRVQQLGQSCPAVPFDYSTDCGILCAPK